MAFKIQRIFVITYEKKQRPKNQTQLVFLRQTGMYIFLVEVVLIVAYKADF